MVATCEVSLCCQPKLCLSCVEFNVICWAVVVVVRIDCNWSNVCKSFYICYMYYTAQWRQIWHRENSAKHHNITLFTIWTCPSWDERAPSALSSPWKRPQALLLPTVHTLNASWDRASSISSQHALLDQQSQSFRESCDEADVSPCNGPCRIHLPRAPLGVGHVPLGRKRCIQCSV